MTCLTIPSNILCLLTQSTQTSLFPELTKRGKNKDSCHTQIHLHSPRHADLFEDFCGPHARLPDDDVWVPPQHRPVNPEDEDDVVPDQHAAFGIQKATQRTREPAWRDLGLAALMHKGPGGAGGGAGGKGGGAAAGAGVGAKGPGNGGFVRGLPR